MHSCEEYKALVSALIDDEISDTDRVSLMAHLVECEECRLYWKDQLAIHEAMADMSAMAPVGFADGVMARVRETKQDQQKKKVNPSPGVLRALPPAVRWSSSAFLPPTAAF